MYWLNEGNVERTSDYDTRGALESILNWNCTAYQNSCPQVADSDQRMLLSQIDQLRGVRAFR